MAYMEEYKDALKMGQRAYREAVSHGDYPYLPALDDMITSSDIEAEISLGMVEIPINQIAGTKTAGRQTAFASNFMPILATSSEFCSKWVMLCESLMEEGLRDGIKAYEYMNRFYVLEGNKRVSVMKHLGSTSIPGQVIRMVPKENGSMETRLYYEFMAFYRYAEINYLNFTKLGSYRKLQQLVGKGEKEAWTAEEIRDFHSFYVRFSKAYEAKAGGQLSLTVSDAILIYLSVYPYADALQFMPADFKQTIAKSFDEFKAAENNEAMALSMEPSDKTANVISRLLNPNETRKIHKIAFIYDKTPESSGWIYGHELGRRYLEQVYSDRITTEVFANVDPSDPKKVYSAIETAISHGCAVIFTTTPRFYNASLQAAVDHPEVKILNCSIHTTHPSIRTYYGRMYEAKFLLGAIAGAMSENDEIGYIADYPIYGMTANINAFALGAKMTNPRAKIFVAWSTTGDDNIRRELKERGICFISDKDMIVPNMPSREFGLYHEHDGEDKPENMATPVWHWGRFYELILKSIKSGSWKNEAGQSSVAVNYWWGMSAGVIDLICSNKLPEGTGRLVELIRQGIISGTFKPFAGKLVDQQGVVRHDSPDSMLPEEIVAMNWLVDNCVGRIPTREELTEEARQVVEIQGM